MCYSVLFCLSGSRPKSLCKLLNKPEKIFSEEEFLMKKDTLPKKTVVLSFFEESKYISCKKELKILKPSLQRYKSAESIKNYCMTVCPIK